MLHSFSVSYQFKKLGSYGKWSHEFETASNGLRTIIGPLYYSKILQASGRIIGTSETLAPFFRPLNRPSIPVILDNNQNICTIKYCKK